MSVAPTQTKLSIQSKTLGKEVSYSGIGLHTGREVKMRFVPAKAGTGIVFRRTDLTEPLEIPASLDYVQDTSRSTNIGIGDVKIFTIEHVMAALRANEISDLIIELTGPEPPAADGSSKDFLAMLEEAGTKELSESKKVYNLREPIYHSDGDIHVVALPHDSFKVSYTLDYPGVKAIASQYISYDLDSESFKRELSECRTFSLYQEVSILMERGLIKGGSLENAVVIKDDVVFSKEGLKFPNEMVRHKTLDLIGDLSLVGEYFNAHIIAIKAGHTPNHALAKKIYQHIQEDMS